MPDRSRAPFGNRMGATTLEEDLRTQRAHDLGPSNPKHLRSIASHIDEDEHLVELPGVDAERLRLLAAKLESDECEIESLREHGNRVHRALCEAIEDLEDLEENPPVVFVFVSADAPFVPEGITPGQFTDLAVFILDEEE